MKLYFRWIASVLAAAILLSLCMTPSVFAMEELGGSIVQLSAATPSDASEEVTQKPSSMSAEAVTPPEPATPPEAVADNMPMEQEPSGDAGFMEPVISTPFNAIGYLLPEPDLASTGEELLAWLEEHKNSEGTLKLTADVYFDDFVYVNIFTKNVTIDTGEFSIIFTGWVEFLCPGLTIQGHGGENGVLRAAKGSTLSIGHMIVKAEEGVAVFQEEGAGLVMTECNLDENAVHYAETPFVWEWKTMVAVAKPGQNAADVLPKMAEAYDVNWRGQMSKEKVPVIWELAGHETSQEQRLRFEAVGSTPGFAYSSAPVCTVVYDDFPLTFLEVSASKSGGGRGNSYWFRFTFSKPEDRLPITVTQEYSFDGENWLIYEENEVKSPNTSLGISVSEDMCDIQSYPDLYIRLSWNDSGTVYYSNVLRYSRDNLAECEDRGGNRGGGTDIMNPPEPPEPDPKPETTPPGSSKPEATPPGSSNPEMTPSPEPSEPETLTPAETLPTAPGQPEHNGTDHEPGGNEGGEHAAPINSDGRQGGLWGPSQGVAPKPGTPVSSSGSSPDQPAAVQGPVSGSISEPVENQGRIPPVEENISDEILAVQQSESPAVSDREAAPSVSTASGQTSAKSKTIPRGPGALPIAAGVVAIAVSFGGAALYLHPKAYPGASRNSCPPGGRVLRGSVWKKLLGKLRIKNRH